MSFSMSYSNENVWLKPSSSSPCKTNDTLDYNNGLHSGHSNPNQFTDFNVQLLGKSAYRAIHINHFYTVKYILRHIVAVSTIIERAVLDSVDRKSIDSRRLVRDEHQYNMKNEQRIFNVILHVANVVKRVCRVSSYHHLDVN